MKKILLVSFIICISNLYLNAQSLPVLWANQFKAQGKNADRIADITSDNAGNVFVAGYAGNHHSAADAFAMKRNANGDTLWIWYYDGGGNNEDYATAIKVDNAGNAYITGRSQGTASVFDCFTAKINAAGVQQWVTRYAAGGTTQSYGNALAVDATGNVYVAGYVDPPSASNDWLVLKYNASGAQQWADVLNGPGNGGDEAWDIVIAPNGNPTVCGFAYSLNASGAINAFIKQYTPANGTVWTDTWNNVAFTGTDQAFGLGYSAAGDLYVGGLTRNSTGFNNDVFAIRYNAAGVQQWTHIYTDATTSVDEYLRKVTVDQNGNVFFTGTDYQDGFTTCILNNGTNGWRKRWKGPVSNGNDVFHGLTVDDIGNSYVTGRGVYAGPNYYGNNGLPNMIITKYNPNGDSLWTYRCADSLNSSMGFAINYNNGKLYAGGFATDTADVDENLFTIIIDTSGNAISEWKYNGRGDAITMGQFVLTDAFNNVYCAATVDRLYNKGYDVALIKYNTSGGLLWEKYYSSYGWNNDSLTAMQFDPAGNLILSISTDSATVTSRYQLSLLKVDQNGNFLDTTYFPLPGSTHARSMKIRSDGSIAMAANSSINGGMVCFFNPSLSPVWSAKIDSTQFAVTRANSIDFFANGDIVVGGFSQVNTVSAGLVQRYTAAGSKLWSASLDSLNFYDEVRDIHVGLTGNVAFTGASGGNTSFSTMTGIINGTNGNLIWKDIYNPNTSNEYGLKVRYAPSGNIALISRGWTGFVARYYTVYYSAAGALQWANAFSPVASDREPLRLLVEPNGNIATAGWQLSGTTSNHDYVLQGYNPAGASIHSTTYTTTGSPSFSWDELADLTQDSQGDFIVTGRTASEFYNTYLFKILTVKYSTTLTSMPTVINPSNESMIHIFPNPSSSGNFTLVDASPVRAVSAKVYDLQGRVVCEPDVNSEEIQLPGKQSGVYILVVERVNGFIERLKLVVE